MVCLVLSPSVPEQAKQTAQYDHPTLWLAVDRGTSATFILPSWILTDSQRVCACGELFSVCETIIICICIVRISTVGVDFFTIVETITITVCVEWVCAAFTDLRTVRTSVFI